MNPPNSEFSNLLKEVFNRPQKDIDEFFNTNFVAPIVNQLIGDETKSADCLRAKLQQTTYIKQYLINFAKKTT